MKKLHYGWAVCLGCTLMLLVSGGIVVNAFAVTQPYILLQNGFTNTQTSMIGTMRMVIYLLCLFATPWFYRKLGARVGCTISAGLGAVSCAMFALAKSLGAYYLAGAVGGLSYGFGSMIPVSILMTHWFNEKRGLAIGICASGTGIAAVVFSPLITAIIRSASLAAAFWVQAAICLILSALVYLLLRNSPAECGKTPYGAVRSMKMKQATVSIRPSRLQWALVLAVMPLISGVSSSGYGHMDILFTTSGFDSMQASVAISLLGLTLIVGKCMYGEICDRIGGFRTNFLFGALLICGLVCCTLSGLGSSALMFAAAACFGFGIPISTVGISVWAADFSPPEQYDRTLQRMQLFYGAGALVFSFVPGWIADVSGSYVPAYWMFAGFIVVSMLVVQSTYALGAREKIG